MAVKYKTRCRLCKEYKTIKPGFAYCYECWKKSIDPELEKDD